MHFDFFRRHAAMAAVLSASALILLACDDSDDDAGEDAASTDTMTATEDARMMPPMPKACTDGMCAATDCPPGADACSCLTDPPGLTGDYCVPTCPDGGCPMGSMCLPDGICSPPMMMPPP